MSVIFKVLFASTLQHFNKTFAVTLRNAISKKIIVAQQYLL